MSLHSTPSKEANAHGSGYERRDVSAGRVLAWVVGLFALAAVVFPLSRSVMQRFTESIRSADGPGHPQSAGAPAPPGPRLQVEPVREVSEHRKSEEARLHSYDWIDVDAGLVRIPIERAKELVLQGRKARVDRGEPAGDSQ